MAMLSDEGHLAASSSIVCPPCRLRDTLLSRLPIRESGPEFLPSLKASAAPWSEFETCSNKPPDCNNLTSYPHHVLCQFRLSNSGFTLLVCL